MRSNIMKLHEALASGRPFRNSSHEPTFYFVSPGDWQWSTEDVTRDDWALQPELRKTMEVWAVLNAKGNVAHFDFDRLTAIRYARETDRTTIVYLTEAGSFDVTK
jgi:hypothetical protein